MKQPWEFAQGIGIGAAVIIALGAVSALVRPGWLVLVPARRTARRMLNPLQQRSLPADYLDRCRAAGL